MKRLCVFYKHANKHLGKKINWIVCKECQGKLHRSTYMNISIFVLPCKSLQCIEKKRNAAIGLKSRK